MNKKNNHQSGGRKPSDKRTLTKDMLDRYNEIARSEDSIHELPDDTTDEELRDAISSLPLSVRLSVMYKYNDALRAMKKQQKEETPDKVEERHLRFYLIRMVATVTTVTASAVILLAMYTALKSGGSNSGKIAEEMLKNATEIIEFIVSNPK